jgi:sugar-specific transcriptional regulator TrmB
MKPAKLLKVHKEELIKRLHKIINVVSETEKLLNAQKTSVILLIHKKGDILNCLNYYILKLLNTAYKILTNILHHISKVHAEELIGNYQSGFH